MIKIAYPDIKPLIKRIDDIEKVFCLIRRKWIVLTPEEWVRQNFLLYLTEVLYYPKKLIAVEKQIRLSAVNKRFDIVVYDQNTQPQIIIECKKMDETLSEEVMNQALRYNMKIKAPIILITNGIYLIGFHNTNNQIVVIDSIDRVKNV